MTELPDIQHNQEPEHKFYINKVGVQSVRSPFILQTRYGSFHELVAKITMTTDLAPSIKGISMSKLIRTLKPYLEKPLKHPLIREILQRLRVEVETDSANSSIRFEFQLPVIKVSPISKHTFPEYYDCAFEGSLVGEKFRFFQKVIVQYASYCPCSASLCEHLKQNSKLGFPHAQRSFAEVLVEVIPPELLWLEDIIDLVEDAVKTIPYPILQRVDEQELARIAAQNAMFVEDAIRRIISNLNSCSKIYDWIVKCCHEESIHKHEAIAVAWKGINGGFDDKKFL